MGGVPVLEIEDRLARVPVGVPADRVEVFAAAIDHPLDVAPFKVPAAAEFYGESPPRALPE